MNIMGMLVDYVLNYEYEDRFKMEIVDKEHWGNIYLIVSIIYEKHFIYTILLYLKCGEPYWCLCSGDGKKYDIQATMTNYATVLSLIENIQKP